MAEGRIQRLQQRVEQERERYPERSRAFKIAWVTAGMIVVAAGIAMVVFPGPAVIVIPIGLLMISFQFAWAQRVIDTGLEGGKAAQGIASRATMQQKILAGAAVACAAAAVIVIAIVVLT